MRAVMAPMIDKVGRLFGLSQSVGTAAARYVDGLDRTEQDTGNFYASAPGKMIGPVERMVQPHILATDSQEAAWQALVQLTGAELTSLKEAV